MSNIDDFVGTTIEGERHSYTIKDNIGHGTFANVYRIEDNAGNSFCLKRTKNFGDWKAYDLAEREAQMLEQNPHNGIPTFYELIKDNLTTSLVMELIDGKNLKELVSSGRRFSEPEIIGIGEQVLDVLGYYHKREIVHRDLKPSNIILNNEGKVKVIDWGSVKYDSIEGSTIAGTSGYAAIEAFIGKAVPASDIFSWGRTMIYLASGVDPLNMEDNENGEINFEKYVSNRLSKKFSRILEKSGNKLLVKDRYQSIEEVKDALRKVNSKDHPTNSSIENSSKVGYRYYIIQRNDYGKRSYELEKISPKNWKQWIPYYGANKNERDPDNPSLKDKLNSAYHFSFAALPMLALIANEIIKLIKLIKVDSG